MKGGGWVRIHDVFLAIYLCNVLEERGAKAGAPLRRGDTKVYSIALGLGVWAMPDRLMGVMALDFVFGA